MREIDIAALEPFESNVKTASPGQTVVIVTGSSGASISGAIVSSGESPSILVTNLGPNIAWVRMSAEATPVATQTDTPMLGNTVRLFSTPVPIGTTGLAVTVSVTTSPNSVYFTLGEGGLI